MQFRIVFIGKTGSIDQILSSAKEINSTARTTSVGLVCPDDCLEAHVESVDEGKALMKHVYKATKCFPKKYSYSPEDRFWARGFSIRYIGTDVYSDRYSHEPGVKEERFEDFLED